MIVLGCVLLLLGWLLHISALVTIGLIVLVIGLVLAVLSSVRGGRHWY
jgi:hypothetical protein